MKIIDRIVERIGRRVWIRRIDAALGRAYSDGIIDSWTLHEIDARAKYRASPSDPYNQSERPASKFFRPDPHSRRCRCDWPQVSPGMEGKLCPRCGWPRAAPGGGTERGT